MAAPISKTTTSQQKNAGFFLVLAPFMLLALMAFSSLVVDIGMMRVTNSQLQTTTDAAALAAANALPNGNDAAIAAAMDIAGRNEMIGHRSANNIQIQLGTWDSDANTFTATLISPTAAKVTATASPPLFFTKLFSSNSYNVTTQSTAALVGGPRDIVFIVDLTPWMSFYSQFAAFPFLSLNTIIANLQAVYNALNLPQLGNMVWTPRLLTGTNASIINALGLKNVAYPFPSGSWNDYITYVKTDVSIIAAGYKNQFGYMTFVNYLLAEQPQFTQTPTLWKTPEQPLQSVKTSLTSFLSQNMTASDRAELITYNRSTSNNSTQEQAFTSNFSLISSVLTGSPQANVPGRQAAHYSTNSNLYPALVQAMDDLNTNGRPNTTWIIYILTASQLANLEGDVLLGDWLPILNEAATAKKDKITINAITFSFLSNLFMGLVAQTTGGTSAAIPASTNDFSQTLINMAKTTGTAQIVK